MKGLLIKDFKLMKNMRDSMIIIILVAVVMSTYISDLSFIVIYLALLGVNFTVSTLSYDEYDNGYAFLISLPVTRKNYVTEKYGFGLIMSTGAWLIGTIIMVIAELVKKTASMQDVIVLALTLLPSTLLLLAVMMPLRLKFGSEKGKIVMIMAMGLTFGVVYMGVMFINKIGLADIGEHLPVLNMGTVCAVGIAAALLLLFLSYRISISIMEKKEF